MKKVFLICPVREISKEERAAITRYVSELETEGIKVHWPAGDTDQVDPIGLRICTDNRWAIEDADEVHVWWNDTSQGSIFDLGMVFALRKKVVLANRDSIEKTVGKSFNNMILALEILSKEPSILR